jgi:hypothetical protein
VRETADRPAELAAFKGITQRVLIGAHCTTDREPCDARSRHTQDLAVHFAFGGRKSLTTCRQRRGRWRANARHLRGEARPGGARRGRAGRGLATIWWGGLGAR